MTRIIAEQVLYDESELFSRHHTHGAFDFEWHYHDEAEISLILQGTGTRYTGDTIALFQGPELLIVPPRLPHTWQSTDGMVDNECLLFQFRTDFLGRPLGEGDTSSLADLFTDGRARRIHPDDTLVDRLHRLHKARGLCRLAVFFEAMERLCNAPFEWANDTPVVVTDPGSEETFARFRQYVETHWYDAIQVPALCAHCRMSESTFRRFFKQVTGMGVIAYLNKMRISRACELLVSSRLTITEISFYAGFNNTSLFNRMFKRLRGMSPRAFRQHYEQG